MKVLNDQNIAVSGFAIRTLHSLVQGKHTAGQYEKDLAEFDPFLFRKHKIKWGETRDIIQDHKLKEIRDSNETSGIVRFEIDGSRSVGLNEIRDYFSQRLKIAKQMGALYRKHSGDIWHTLEGLYGGRIPDGIHLPDLDSLEFGEVDIADISHRATKHPFSILQNHFIRKLYVPNNEGYFRRVEYLEALNEVLSNFDTKKIKSVEERARKMVRNQGISIVNAQHVLRKKDAEFQIRLDEKIVNSDFLDGFVKTVDWYNHNWRRVKISTGNDGKYTIFSMTFRGFLEAFSRTMPKFADFFKDHLDFSTEQVEGDYEDFIDALKTSNEQYRGYQVQVEDYGSAPPMARACWPAVEGVTWEDNRISPGMSLDRLSRKIFETAKNDFIIVTSGNSLGRYNNILSSENYKYHGVWEDGRGSIRCHESGMYKRKLNYALTTDTILNQ